MAAIVGACSLPVFLAGALAVQIKEDLALGDTAFGLAFSGYFALATLCSTTAGRLAEGARSAVALKFAAACASMSMLATAALARSPRTFILTIGLAGVAMAAAEPAGNVLVMQLVPRARHGLAIGLKQATYPLVTLLSGLAVPALGLTVGWRWAFVAGGAVAGFWIFLVPSARGTTSATTAGSKRFTAPTDAMLVLAFGVACGSAAATAYSGFVVASAVDTGISRAGAGLVFAAAGGLGLPLRLAVGHLADRPSNDALRVAAVMATLGAGGYALLATASGALFVAGALLAFGAGWGWIGVFHLAVTRLNPANPGAATGFTQTGTYAGAVLGPVLFGVVAESSSYQWGWATITFILVAGAAALLLGDRLALRQRPPGRPSPWSPPGP